MVPNRSSSYAVSETASASDDLHDYDVISDGPRSMDSSIADLGSPTGPPREISPSAEAKRVFDTAAFGVEEVQAYVQRTLKNHVAGTSHRGKSRDPAERETPRTVRVYVDGIFDILHVANALQLRQAKLSFPSVHILVGPFTDEQCQEHGIQALIPHVERCELIRHCRWVDEVVYDAPVVLDEAFLSQYRIDYVAVEEGSSVDPAVIKARCGGYDLVKGLGKALPTRRTRGVVASSMMLSQPSPPAAPSLGRVESTSTFRPLREQSVTDEDPPEPKEEFGA